MAFNRTGVKYITVRLRYIFAIGLGIIVLSILVFGFLNFYGNQDITSGMFSVKSITVSPQVHLHRTSGRDVMIADQEGFGLVNDRVQRAYIDKTTGKLYIEYIEHSDSKLDVVVIDIGTGKVSPVLLGAPQRKKLRPIEKLL